MKTTLLALLLTTVAQAQRPVGQCVLEWSPRAALLKVKPSGVAVQVLDIACTDAQALASAMAVLPNARALLYIHCWLGETRFFHRRSMGWLAHSLQTSSDTSPVVVLALRWPSGKRGYRRSALQAEKKGAAFAPVLRTLAEVFPDGRLDVFCHSMGNHFFRAAWQRSATVRHRSSAMSCCFHPM